MSLNKKIVSGSFWSLIGSSGYQLSGLVIFIILSRILSPIDFGTAALAIVFVELTNVLVRFGLEQVVIRTTEVEEDFVQNNVFVATLLIGIVTSITFIFAAPYIESFFNAPGLAISLQILSVVPVMQGLTTAPNGILKRNFKFKALAVRLLISSIIAGLVAIYLAYNGFGFYSLVVQKIISISLELFLVWKSIKWRPVLKLPYGPIISILKQGQPIVLSALIGQGIFRFVELIIGYFLGVAALGSFKIAGKLLDVIVQFTIKPIVDVSFSAFSKLQDNPYKLEACFVQFITTTGLFALPIFAGGYIIGSDMVYLIFGDKWAESGLIFSILCLTGLSASFNYFFAPLCHSTHNSHIPFRLRIFEFIAVIFLVSIFSQYSIYHVAFSNVVTTSLITITMAIIIKYKFKFSLNSIAKALLPSIISALAMLLGLYLILNLFLQNTLPIEKITYSIVVGCVIYSAVYRLLFPKHSSEMLSNIRDLLQKKK